MLSFARNETIANTLAFQTKLNNEHLFYYQT